MNYAFEIPVDPVMFELGPLSIRWYGVMMALALIVLIIWTIRENNKKQVISSEGVFTAAVIAIPAGIIVSKLLHVIDKLGYYIDNPGRILSGEGLTIWGAVIGATLGIWIYSRLSKQFSFGKLVDLMAPGIILAQAIGRVGCTLNGCCYGLETDLACGIVYTHPDSYGPLGIAVLPTQVFEIFYDLIVFGILFSLRGKLKPDGGLFTVYYALYGLWRFGVEFIREGSPFLFGMHQAQVIGIIVLLITVPIIIMKVRLKKPEEREEAVVQDAHEEDSEE
jgi:phosphatidylglycerol---prolipoprotein diacylglyceryl transferase